MYRGGVDLSGECRRGAFAMRAAEGAEDTCAREMSIEGQAGAAVTSGQSGCGGRGLEASLNMDKHQ